MKEEKERLMHYIDPQYKPLFIAVEDPEAPENQRIPDLSRLTFEGFSKGPQVKDPTPKGRIGEIQPVSRTKCFISIGEPITTKLAGQALRSLDVSMHAQCSRYDFYSVMLACSFRSASNYPFREASFGVTFEAEESNGSPALCPAIAYDLYPLLVEDESPITRKLALTPALKFTCMGGVEAALPLPAYEHTDTYVQYTSRIEAFDLQGSAPRWSFQRTKAHAISGPQRLFVLLRTRKKSRVRATFQMHASVNALNTVHQLVLRFKSSDSASAEVPATYLW